MPVLAIVSPLEARLAELVALVAHVSDEFLLSIVATQVKRPVIRGQCVRIVHVLDGELWRCVRILVSISIYHLVELIFQNSLLLARAIFKVLNPLLLHCVLNELQSIIDVDIIFHRHRV